MTFLSIIGVLILGLVVLVIGFVTKKLWLKLVSIIPLAISLVQIFILLVMGK
jgi:hypothetical protein